MESHSFFLFSSFMAMLFKTQHSELTLWFEREVCHPAWISVIAQARVVVIQYVLLAFAFFARISFSPLHERKRIIPLIRCWPEYVLYNLLARIHSDWISTLYVHDLGARPLSALDHCGIFILFLKLFLTQLRNSKIRFYGAGIVWRGGDQRRLTQLDEVSNSAHDKETHSYCLGDFDKFATVG